MTTVLIFLVVLLVLVLVHEAGHALAARLSGCRVEEFGFGFPPRLLGGRLGETEFSLNTLPLGGFVRITGEDGTQADDPRSFAARPRWARALILAAGVIGNLLLAVILFTLVAGFGADIPVEGATRLLENPRVQVVELRDTPVLRAADLRTRDVITAVEGTEVRDASEAAERVRGFSGAELSLTIRRGDRILPITLRFDPPKEPNAVIGIALLDVATARAPWRQAPLEGIRMTGRTIVLTGQGIGRVVRDAVVQRKAPEEIAGPVGIAALTGAVAHQGIVALLELTGVLSVNLALVNILPIPALDGGRLLFLFLDALGIRWLRGRPERLAHTIGFAILLALLALITVGDLQRLAQ